MPPVADLIRRADAPLVMCEVVRAGLAALDPDEHPVIVGVRVSTRLPPGTTPTRHVRVRRTGGVMVNVVEDAARLDYQVRVETGDETADEAARTELAGLVYPIIFAARNTIVNGARVGRSEEFVGPGTFDDPDDPTREIILFTVETRLRAVGA